MATLTESKAPASPQSSVVQRQRIVLRGIPWSLYTKLRSLDSRPGLRMSYLNGVLELVSPEYSHEQVGDRLRFLIRTIAVELQIPCAGAGSTTFQLPGDGDDRGAAEEPDACFYFAHEPLIRGKRRIDLPEDPPPDLAIEVDNTRSSAAKMPIYAALGVPEVWRFDVETRTLLFEKLLPTGQYIMTDHSPAIPMLTPVLVIEALDLCQDVSESEWGRRLRDWVHERLTRPS